MSLCSLTHPNHQFLPNIWRTPFWAPILESWKWIKAINKMSDSGLTTLEVQAVTLIERVIKHIICTQMDTRSLLCDHIPTDWISDSTVFVKKPTLGQLNFISYAQVCVLLNCILWGPLSVSDVILCELILWMWLIFFSHSPPMIDFSGYMLLLQPLKSIFAVCRNSPRLCGPLGLKRRLQDTPLCETEQLSLGLPDPNIFHWLVLSVF